MLLYAADWIIATPFAWSYAVFAGCALILSIICIIQAIR